MPASSGVTSERESRWLADERRRLERVIAELAAAEMDQRTEEDDLGEVASCSQHPADVASETLEREVEIGLLDEFRTALAELDAAVARADQGRYGSCERCGTAIPPDRLRAVPATRWCLACAKAAERDARWHTPPSRSSAVLASDEFLATDDVSEAEVADVVSGEEAALSVRDLFSRP